MKLHTHPEEFRELITVVANEKHISESAVERDYYRLKGVPNILDDVIETSQIFYDASWEDIQNAAAFLENQVYSFSSTGQTFGIARRDMSQRLPRLMSAYNRIRDAIILHRD